MSILIPRYLESLGSQTAGLKHKTVRQPKDLEVSWRIWQVPIKIGRLYREI